MELTLSVDPVNCYIYSMGAAAVLAIGDTAFFYIPRDPHKPTITNNLRGSGNL